MRRSVAALSILLLSPAAFGAEDELLLGIEPTYGLLAGATDRHGAGGHLSLSLGLTDAIWLTLAGGGTRQLSRGDLEGLTMLEAFGGLTVALDVLRTIPFIEGLIGVVGAKVAGSTKISPTVRLGVGFDFLLTPSVSLGAVFRYRPVSDDFGDAYYTAAVRLVWRIEL
jgi:hypothetical protein